jgi:YfiH family protein
MDEFVLKYADHGLWYGIFAHFTALGIKHGVSTRFGGASCEPFASLNLALHTGDDAQKVIMNRQRFCNALKIDYTRIVTAQQVHKDHIAVVAEKDIGKGKEEYAKALLNTDALITNLPNVPLMLFFADCVPVLIADPVRHVVGVSHAGWKGTVAKIAQKTVLAMQKNFGTRQSDCLVGIAPSIGPCCYEVDDVVVKQLQENFKDWRKLITSQKDHWLLDLWAANRFQLEEIGVLRNNIVTSGICTSCNENLFFSYRADKGHTGRIAAVISL